MNNLIIIALPLIALANMIIGITIGIFHERQAWNALITSGKIRKPIMRRIPLTTH